MTVAFLGHRPKSAADAVARVAFAAGRDLPAPVLSGAGLRGLPHGRPRLWALALDDETGRATALAGAVGRGLAGAGLFEPERRPFWPHVTLLRARGRGDGGRRPGAPPALAFTAAELVLYRSIMGPAGARYEVLARVGLPRNVTDP